MKLVQSRTQFPIIASSYPYKIYLIPVFVPFIDPKRGESVKGRAGGASPRPFPTSCVTLDKGLNY